ncbi:MAG: hypothetical protein JO040_10920, partial [Gemmatimonadetes bacterium]|nr:hypothetical protein [Gemmatimonadota bacterium]
MRTIALGAALLALAAALPATAGAQEQGGKLVPFAGLAIGGSGLPDELLDRCDPGNSVALEGRAGVARGAFALEARGALLGVVSTMDCVTAFVPSPPRDGTYTETVYPFTRGNAHTAADLRVRFGGTRSVPVSVSGGGGWLVDVGVPYLLAGAGVHTGG